MNKETLATSGAIGASFLIGACCLAPALFVLFGVSVGALGALTSLEPYRPLFIVVGGASLLYAARRSWTTQPEADPACDDGSCAVDSPQRRRTRRLIVGAFVLYTIAIAYPYAVEALL